MGIRNLLVLALLVPALGLQAKSDDALGLDQGLDGIPQRLAKAFAKAAAGKATQEEMDSHLQEIFDKTLSLPRDKKMKLAQAVAEMFPDDAVDLDEVVDLKYSEAAQSFLQSMEQVEEPRITIGGYRSKGKDPLEKDNWQPWYDDWKERGLKKPEMRGPWDYKSETTLSKNLRMSEEHFAQDSCVPDQFLSCFTKDITYLPCRTYNNCMATFNNFAAKQPMYVDSAKKVGAALSGAAAAGGIYQFGAGVCSAANTAALPMFMSSNAGLNQVGLGTAPKPDATPGTNEKFVPIEERLPCSVAYGGNVKLANMAKKAGSMALDRAATPFLHANGNDAKKANEKAMELGEAMIKEATK